jgi:photosystem II stability/assembly factor-like uncharacterized protein
MFLRFLVGAAFAACLFASDVKHFSNWNYRPIGPANMGGRGTDVEAIPGNPNTVYFATGGGGLWKSVNGGVTWTALFERENTYSIGDIALDPRNPDTIWLGSGEANMRNSVSFGDGVYRSTDGGKSWKHLGLKETEHIARVQVSPLDSNTAWVCAVGHQSAPNEERGVFVTNDGGKSWQKTLYLDDKHGCADLEVNPSNPNVLYAAMWRFQRWPWNHTSGSEQSGVYKSIDGGKTWTKLTKGLPKLIGRAGVKVAPSNPSTVYIACESKEGTFYQSTDAGESWTQMTKERSVVSRGFYYADIRVDPKNENRVYSLATNLQVTIDGGKTWKQIANRIHSDHHGMWIDPTNTARIWLVHDGGIAASYDGGESWEAILNIPLGQYYQVHADNVVPFYNITGGLQDNGTWRGPVRARQNHGLTNADWSLINFGDGFYAWSSPEDPNILLAESQGGYLARLDLSSGESQMVSPQPRFGRIDQLKYRFHWNTPIVGSPHGRGTIYFGGNVLFQSRDSGKSWEPISPDLTTNNPEKLKSAGGPVWMDNSTAENHCTIISVQESPAKAGIIWVGTDDGNVQVTADGGKSWTNVAKNVPGVPELSPVSHVEPSRTGANTAYVAFDRHFFDDYRPHIFKTTDGGKTFTRLTNGLPEKAYVQVVREDPKNPNVLYAGTELGLFITFDGGANWQPALFKNLPKVAIHDILVHPRENDLILGTHGRSLMILDDITPLQQMTPEIAAKKAHLFDARPAWRHATPMRTYGLGNKNFVAQNPPAGAILSYFLKEKIDDKAPMKLEILDAAGKVIRTVEKPPREAGINRINWDMRYDGPKIRNPPDPDEIEFEGGPRGPQVVPGIYTARLTVGQDTAQTRIEVQLDPALRASAQDLATQRDLGLKLRDLASSLNTSLKRMDSLKDQLDDLDKLGKTNDHPQKAEWSKSVEQYKKEIDAVSEKLGMKKGASGLEDPARLAEDITGLYYQLAAGNSAPTAAQTALAAELEKRHVLGMAEASKLISTATSQWNESLRKLGAPGLVAESVKQ